MGNRNMTIFFYTISSILANSQGRSQQCLNLKLNIYAHGPKPVLLHSLQVRMHIKNCQVKRSAPVVVVRLLVTVGMSESPFSYTGTKNKRKLPRILPSLWWNWIRSGSQTYNIIVERARRSGNNIVIESSHLCLYIEQFSTNGCK